MFIYSLRANSVKLLGILCVSLTVLIALIVFVPTYSVTQPVSSGNADYTYDKIKSGDDVKNFLSQFGWETDAEPKEILEVTIPEEFDKTYSAYNEIQKSQGLDLLKYKGKAVTKYCFRVTNYEGATSPVFADVLVYRKKVIGGDLYSENFIRGFEKTK